MPSKNTHYNLELVLLLQNKKGFILISSLLSILIVSMMAQLVVMTFHQYDTFYSYLHDQLETQNEQYFTFINSIMPYVEKQEEDMDSMQNETSFEEIETYEEIN